MSFSMLLSNPTRVFGRTVSQARILAGSNQCLGIRRHMQLNPNPSVEKSSVNTKIANRTRQRSRKWRHSGDELHPYRVKITSIGQYQGPEPDSKKRNRMYSGNLPYDFFLNH